MKKENPDKKNPYQIFEDNGLGTNACTECTGMMPTPPKDAEEWETYQDIFHFTPEPDARESEKQKDSFGSP